MNPIDAVMSRTFCGHQFGKMLFSSIITTFIVNFNFVANKILAAQLFGKNAMAGIEIVLPLLFITAFLELMVAMGTAYLYSFEIGSFKTEVANRLAGQGAFWTLFLSVILTMSFFFGENIYFSLYSNAEAATTFAREYYRPFLLTIAVHPIYVFMQRMVFADGGGKYCIFATVLQFVVHVATALFLTTMLDFGMAGMALSIFISEIVAMTIFLRWIFFVSQTMKPTFHCSLADTIKVLKLGYVSSSVTLYFSIGNMLLVIYFLRNFDQEYFPILSAIISISQLSYCFSGIEKAAEPIINVYLGEDNFNGVIKVMKPAIMTAFSAGVFAVPFLWFFSESIADVFGVADSNLLTESVNAIKTFALAMPFISMLHLFTMYYQINGYFKIAVSLSFCKDFLFYVGLPIVFSLFFGLHGIWLGLMVAYLGTFCLFTALLRVRYPKSFPLLAPKQDIVSKDVSLDVQKVIDLRGWVETEFEKRSVPSQNVMKIGLLIEEIGMSIVDHNPGTNVLAELTVFFEGEPKIILRDNGIRFDMTTDNLVSFRDFFLYSFLTEENIGNKFLETQNYNRHFFRFSPK